VDSYSGSESRNSEPWDWGKVSWGLLPKKPLRHKAMS
jgi:hypothetical protein